MGRTRKFIHGNGFFHVGSRTNNRIWFQCPIEEVWDICSHLLHFISHAYDIEIAAFVLMDNHFHMLVRVKNANLPAAMRYFLCELSRALNRTQGTINHNFGGRYTATAVTDLRYLQAVYKYIYRNPVEAGFKGRVEEYPWSTLRGLLGFEKLLIPTYDPLDLTENTESLLQWMNHDFLKGQTETIRRGLRSPTFDWKTGREKVNTWTDDLVFSTNALSYQKVNGTFG